MFKRNNQVIRIAVVVPTFGPDRAFWDNLAHRAVGSVAKQTLAPHELHRVHVDQENALHIARNRGAAMSSSEFLVFLDADDMLHPEYIAAMTAGEGDVRIPNVERFWPNGAHETPHPIKEPDGGDLTQTSHILIGAAVSRDLFIKVGGFEDLPVWEDWHFWCKCWLDGASMIRCPKAIYQAYMRTDSRSHPESETRKKLGSVTARRIRDEFRPLARARGMLAEQRNAEEIKRRFGIVREAAT